MNRLFVKIIQNEKSSYLNCLRSIANLYHKPTCLQRWTFFMGGLLWQVPWPLDIIIDEDAILVYNQVFRFLLQVKRAKYSLDQLSFTCEFTSAFTYRCLTYPSLPTSNPIYFCPNKHCYKIYLGQLEATKWEFCFYVNLRVVIRAPDSNSGVSGQQSEGSSIVFISKILHHDCFYPSLGH